MKIGRVTLNHIASLLGRYIEASQDDGPQKWHGSTEEDRMTEVQVDIIELAGVLGYQAGQIDGLSGNTHGAGIPKVKMDIRDTIRDLNPVMRSSFWIVFDREYEKGWNRGKTEPQG